MPPLPTQVQISNERLDEIAESIEALKDCGDLNPEGLAGVVEVWECDDSIDEFTLKEMATLLFALYYQTQLVLGGDASRRPSEEGGNTCEAEEE